MQDAVAKVVDDHRRRGQPLAVWHNGKAVWLPEAEAIAARKPPAPAPSKPHGVRKPAPSTTSPFPCLLLSSARDVVRKDRGAPLAVPRSELRTPFECGAGRCAVRAEPRTGRADRRAPRQFG